MTTVWSSRASLSKKSRLTESILLYTYRLDRIRKSTLRIAPGILPFDILPVILHDDVDEIIHSCCQTLASCPSQPVDSI